MNLNNPWLYPITRALRDHIHRLDGLMAQIAPKQSPMTPNEGVSPMAFVPYLDSFPQDEASALLQALSGGAKLTVNDGVHHSLKLADYCCGQMFPQGAPPHPPGGLVKGSPSVRVDLKSKPGKSQAVEELRKACDSHGAGEEVDQARAAGSHPQQAGRAQGFGISWQYLLSLALNMVQEFMAGTSDCCEGSV
jgi:hypothetical protein